MSSPDAIILITTDEQHRASLGRYGGRAVSTPNIDSIAESGLAFDRCYSASPVSLPSRCSMATGLYPHRSRSYSNIFGASLNTRWPSIMQICQGLGYRTSLHGKGHFMPCPYRETRRDITRDLAAVKPFYMSLGFDHIDLQDDKNNSLWFYDDYSLELERHGLLKACRDGRRGQLNKHTAGYFFPGPPEMHADSWVGRKAVDYIRSMQAGQPCFMWISFSGPHYPIDTHRDYYARVDMRQDTPRVRHPDEWQHPNKIGYASYHGPGGSEGSGPARAGAQKNHSDEYWREWRRMYYGNVLQIDDWIGRILAAVEEKWGDNVMVVFTTDHGDMMGNHDLWGKNNLMFDDILRVPLYIRCPGLRHMGVRDELVSLVDLMPTLVREAGYRGGLDCDGRELLSLVEEGGRDHVLCEADNRFAIITREGKKHVEARLAGHEFDADGRRKQHRYEELYDLTTDPHEFRNLRNSGADIRGFERCESLRERYQDPVSNVLFYDDFDRTPPWYVDEPTGWASGAVGRLGPMG